MKKFHLCTTTIGELAQWQIDRTFRSIKQGARVGGQIVETVDDAARGFADRWAKRKFGRRGRVKGLGPDGILNGGAGAVYTALLVGEDRRSGYRDRDARFAVVER